MMNSIGMNVMDMTYKIGDTMYNEVIQELNKRFVKTKKYRKINYVAKVQALELLRYQDLTPQEVGDAFELILKELIAKQNKKEKVEYQINDSLFYDVEIGADQAP